MIASSMLVCAALLATFQTARASGPERPQTPVRPLPYDEREVVIPATARSQELAGTLTRPRGSKAVAAVLLVQGGSPFDRDGTLAKHKPLFVLSEALTRAGFATLRVDDRGVGGSKGAKLAATLDDLSHDVDACVGFLRAQDGIRADRVGLVGHSGGALTCALVASRDRDLAFVALLGCPARPFPVAVGWQMAAEGDGDLEMNELLAQAAAEIVRRSQASDGLVEAVERRWTELVEAMSEPRRAMAGRYVSSMSRKLPVLLGSAYLRDVFCFDPGPIVRSIACPALAIWGELDQGRKLANTSAWEMARGLAEGASASFCVVQVARTNHFLQPCDTGGMDEIAKTRETMSPEALRTIVEWSRRWID